MKVCGKGLRNENLQGGPAGEENPGPLCTVPTFFAWGADPRSPGRAVGRKRIFIFVPSVTRGQGVVAVSAVGSPAFTGPLLDPPHNPQHPKNTSFPRILERDGRRCRPSRHLHRAASSGRLPGRLCLKNSLTADSSSLVALFYLLSPSAVAFGIVNTRP